MDPYLFLQLDFNLNRRSFDFSFTEGVLHIIDAPKIIKFQPNNFTRHLSDGNYRTVTKIFGARN